jgi:hypothetical protein
MPAPAIYLDECVDGRLAVVLRQRGYSVTTAADEHLTGVDDETQLAYATSNGLAIVSHNSRHFWRLHRGYLQQGRLHHGIFILPQRVTLDVLTVRAAMLLDWAAERQDPQGELYQWGKLQALLEYGHRLPRYTDADVRLALGRP